MSIPSFLKERQQKKQKNRESNKGDFRVKCRQILEQIKGYNEDAYKELNRVFQAQYDKVNVQKKVILGFYGRLKQELYDLKKASGEKVHTTTKKVFKKSPLEIQKEVKKVTKKVAKKATAAKKKVAKKATAAKKKVTKKKTAKKKTTKKR